MVKVKGRVVFLHPDLGLGGAERLVVDAAYGLKKRGYEVTLVTGYHDPNHAFPETTDGTLKVITVGSWIPRNIFGKFFAFCAYLRMIYAAFYLHFSGLRPNVVVCDLVSACIPMIRWNLFSTEPRIIFYCHFPDQLLTQRNSFLKALYRKPIDWFEEYTTKQADKILVNSIFTRGVFERTFKSIRTMPGILYPSINSRAFDESRKEHDQELSDLLNNNCSYTFLSINRFEPKKNIALAIRSLRKLKTCIDEDAWKNVHLVLAGGYDPRIESSVEYLAKLKQITKEEDVEEKVTFVLSPKDHIKVRLLHRCCALLYTPSEEHFGIVPLEAMYVSKPVIAVDSGGPRETVIDGSTGFLFPSNETHFAVGMARLILEPGLGKRLGQAGKKHFTNQFSFDAFASNWDVVVQQCRNGTD